MVLVQCVPVVLHVRAVGVHGGDGGLDDLDVAQVRDLINMSVCFS